MSTTPATTEVPTEWQQLAQEAINAKKNAYCKFFFFLSFSRGSNSGINEKDTDCDLKNGGFIVWR